MRSYKRSGLPIEFVQIFGERNSGTTYLSKLLQDNMRVPTNLLGMAESEERPLGIKVFGYKHWFLKWEKFADARQNKTLFVVIYRNPYTWLRAMMERPYALSKSISGRTVKELPDVKLAGHINGKDTSNEFDPETGEQLTIFELRKKKIEHFEALKSQVDNVVYLNLEEFLENPAAVIQRLATEFGTAFKPSLSLDRAPYKQLVDEYHSPKKFAEPDMTILNRSINWKAENSIGYRKDDYTFWSGRSSAFVILHGGSAVGKSYLMKKLVVGGDNLVGIEMDVCQYWDHEKAEFSLAKLQVLLPEATEEDFADFLRVANLATPKGKRCIEYLLTKLNESDPHQQDKPCAFISTCGALPDPGLPGVLSIYDWLSERLPVSFHHLLIEIPHEDHIRQIEKRGRSHLQADILHHHAMKTSKRDFHDAIASDYEGVVDFVRTTIGREPLSNAAAGLIRRKPRVRLQKPRMTHIQIYGERNSGTKYLTQLVSLNARDSDSVLGSYASKKDPINRAKLIGYKHYYPRPEKLIRHQDKTLFLVIYKNPYTWIRSMFAKPYHFRNCLEGKSITDLPNIKLAGFDIHGRAIPDTHPDTGERITLFELRKFKIQQWENLVNLVGNVAYINYEDLLLSPTEVIQRIVDEFGSWFDDTNVPEQVPDEKYVTKYITPKPFSDDELTVMNANIDWSAEALAGYEKNNFFVPG
ncbi:MAG: hypothetical protein KUG69_14055 [Marinosulfonomonas sp.]|nr:hypothetical protein [Marinosulfonomonas sp.]